MACSAENSIQPKEPIPIITNVTFTCSVTNTGSCTVVKDCNGEPISYTFTESCAVEASSCNPADLYTAGIVAGICAGIKATKTAKLQSAFLPPCES